MQILMPIVNTVNRGGTYGRALQLARALAKRGHSATVLATAARRRRGVVAWADRQAGVTVVEAPDLLPGALRSGWDGWNTLNRIVWLRGRRFDLVHAFEARPTVIFPALYAKRCLRAPLILDWCDWFGRGGSVEERPNPVVRTLLRPVETFFEEHFRTAADGTTVINSVLRLRAQALGVPPARIFDLPNGSDVEGLRPLPRDEARLRLGLPGNAPIVGYMGAVFARDAVLMARAFDCVRAARPDARLLLVGCNAPIEKLVAAPAAVINVGPVPYEQVNLYLAACDLGWLPFCDSGANRGRYPFKLGDYMAAGLPVVATAVGDVTEMVARGGFGRLAADRPDELAAEVVALLDAPDERAALGRRARRVAENEFTWDLIAGRLEGFYRDIVRGSPDARPAVGRE